MDIDKTYTGVVSNDLEQQHHLKRRFVKSAALAMAGVCLLASDYGYAEEALADPGTEIARLKKKLEEAQQENESLKNALVNTPAVAAVAVNNVNLEEAVAASHFRADLYYRFNVATIQLTPLRERPGDILPLARHFLSIYGERLGYGDLRLTPAAEQTLLNYDWPGNIRELENAIHRALLVCPGNNLRSEDFKLSGIRIQDAAPAVSTASLESAVQRLCEVAPPDLFGIIEETVIKTVFAYCEGNQVQTAKMLDISRNVLRHKLGIYNLLPKSGRKPIANVEELAELHC